MDKTICQHIALGKYEKSEGWRVRPSRNIWTTCIGRASNMPRILILTISLTGISVRPMPLRFNLLFFTLSLMLSTVILYRYRMECNEDDFDGCVRMCIHYTEQTKSCNEEKMNNINRRRATAAAHDVRCGTV